MILNWWKNSKNILTKKQKLEIVFEAAGQQNSIYKTNEFKIETNNLQYSKIFKIWKLTDFVIKNKKIHTNLIRKI